MGTGVRGTVDRTGVLEEVGMAVAARVDWVSSWRSDACDFSVDVTRVSNPCTAELRAATGSPGAGEGADTRAAAATDGFLGKDAAGGGAASDGTGADTTGSEAPTASGFAAGLRVGDATGDWRARGAATAEATATGAAGASLTGVTEGMAEAGSTADPEAGAAAGAAEAGAAAGTAVAGS